eukprot:scaffold106636_cov36-Phaeocystis_antarctica.AAC.2
MAPPVPHGRTHCPLPGGCAVPPPHEWAAAGLPRAAPTLNDRARGTQARRARCGEVGPPAHQAEPCAAAPPPRGDGPEPRPLRGVAPPRVPPPPRARSAEGVGGCARRRVSLLLRVLLPRAHRSGDACAAQVHRRAPHRAATDRGGRPARKYHRRVAPAQRAGLVAIEVARRSERSVARRLAPPGQPVRQVALAAPRMELAHELR